MSKEERSAETARLHRAQDAEANARAQFKILIGRHISGRSLDQTLDGAKDWVEAHGRRRVIEETGHE